MVYCVLYGLPCTTDLQTRHATIGQNDTTLLSTKANTTWLQSTTMRRSVVQCSF